MLKRKTVKIRGISALAAALTLGTAAQANPPLQAHIARHDGEIILQMTLDISQVNQSPRLNTFGFDQSLDAFVVRCEAYQAAAIPNSTIGIGEHRVLLWQVPQTAGEVIDVLVPYQSQGGQYYPDTYQCELRMIRDEFDRSLVLTSHHQHQGSTEDLIVQGEIDAPGEDVGPLSIDAGQLSYVGPTAANYSGALIFDAAVDLMRRLRFSFCRQIMPRMSSL